MKIALTILAVSLATLWMKPQPLVIIINEVIMHPVEQPETLPPVQIYEWDYA